MQSHGMKALRARRTKMSHKAAAALAVLLVLGTASAVRVDADDRIAASRLAAGRSAPFCRDGIAVRSRAWIKLTEPGGKPFISTCNTSRPSDPTPKFPVPGLNST
jgi:hypothetical protein